LTLLFCFVAVSNNQLIAAPDVPEHARVKYFQDSPVPQAVVLSVNGPCQYSLDNNKTNNLKAGDVLNEGAIIHTGKKARVDLFLRRLAITVRVTSETDLALEKMAKYAKDDAIVMETILDLRAGQIFCFVRGLVPNSRFEVKHASGRSIVAGEGSGGFEIRADSPVVTQRTSFIPLKVISEKSVSVTAPGEKSDGKEGKTIQLAPTATEDTLMQLDELQALAELLSPDEELTKKK
jgi:hypothetical protein